LTWLVAKTDFKLSYFGSVLGYLWSLMQPLLFFGVLYVMFSLVLQLGKTTPDFPVLLLMNIVLFNFFQQATGASIPSVVQRENLVRKMHFPRLVIPMATVVTAAINLLLNLIVVIGFMLAYGVNPRTTWLLMPVILLLLFALTAGVSMLLSALYVRYRDVSQIWGVISQTLFYASPVFILIEEIQAKAPGVVRYYLFNPIAAILQQARHWMVGVTYVPNAGPGHPRFVGFGPAAYMGGRVWLLVPALILIVTCVVGYRVFSRQAPLIAEEL
jgi:ABC-2 type transport system permease protein